MKHQSILGHLPLALSLGLLASPVLAESLTGGQVLQEFNLVVIGNATSSSEVDGRSFIGGTLNGGIYAGHPSATPASDYAGLTVLGDAGNVQVNGFGAVIGGNLTNSIINSGSSAVFGNASGNNFNGPAYVATNGGNNFNGGQDASLANATAVTASTSTDFGSVLTGLSTQLSQLADTGSTVVFDPYGKVTFNAVANAGGVAVFDLTGVDTAVFNAHEYQFNLNGATTLILNSDELTPTISANFIGGGAQAIGAATLWNFYGATNLTINNQFGGSVLAPLAAFSNYQNIEGGVFVNTLVQRGEIHLQPFNGQIPPVPEPESYALLLLGLGFLGVISRRRTSAYPA
ncbi:MAG: choice-of-anchor A family protein [Gammaproteobacteria bacterium]|nr:choice-of-anchor A family protein [Gammaproteobacteria bacterium]MBU1775498.1 choice-of-anchor A family protein [Gammaproteobacteria bacterium]MBU1969563.1 choice-of-anchor A family protein [Gammaproteobacteria bacterium]